ncbi:MAG: hypothetical protein IBX63_08385 [Coriobacteriia bacterium]|nr:hypothetical protein [Coriobacteriia bacterium]
MARRLLLALAVLAFAAASGCSRVTPQPDGDEATNETSASYVPGWLAKAKEPPEGERWADITGVAAFTLDEAKARPDRFQGIELQGATEDDVRGYLVSVSGRALDPEETSSVEPAVITCDGGLMTGQHTVVDLDRGGRFSIGFEFSRQRTPLDSPFDLAVLNRQYVFVDLVRGVWAETDGGELHPIENWERVSSVRDSPIFREDQGIDS